MEKSYAIQAGREIRVMVNHTLVSDADAAVLAEEVSRRIETELEYPGQIKIMVHPGNAGHGRGPLGRDGTGRMHR